MRRVPAKQLTIGVRQQCHKQAPTDDVSGLSQQPRSMPVSASGLPTAAENVPIGWHKH